jgi:WD40 repeat protein
MKSKLQLLMFILVASTAIACTKKDPTEQKTDQPTVVTNQEKKSVNPWAEQAPKHIGSHDQSAYHVVFSHDGKTLASTGQDKLIKLWNTQTSEIIKSLSGHRDKVMMAAFSPNDELLISVSTDQTARIWNLKNKKPPKVILDKPPSKMTEEEELAYQQLPPAHMNWAAFSPDGKSVITASDDFALKLWDIATGKKTGHFKDDGCRQRSVHRRTDATGWASSAGCMDDGVTYLKFWDAEGNLSRVFGDEVHDAHYLAFDQGGKYIIAADGSLAFTVFSAQGSLLKRVLIGGYHFCVHFGHLDKTLLIGTQKGEILVYQPGTWIKMGKLKVGEPVPVDSIAVNPIDGRIAAALRNGKIITFPNLDIPTNN